MRPSQRSDRSVRGRRRGLGRADQRSEQQQPDDEACRSRDRAIDDGESIRQDGQARRTDERERRQGEGDGEHRRPPGPAGEVGQASAAVGALEGHDPADQGRQADGGHDDPRSGRCPGGRVDGRDTEKGQSGRGDRQVGDDVAEVVDEPCRERGETDRRDADDDEDGPLRAELRRERRGGCVDPGKRDDPCHGRQPGQQGRERGARDDVGETGGPAMDRHRGAAEGEPARHPQECQATARQVRVGTADGETAERDARDAERRRDGQRSQAVGRHLDTRPAGTPKDGGAEDDDAAPGHDPGGGDRLDGHDRHTDRGKSREAGQASGRSAWIARSPR